MILQNFFRRKQVIVIFLFILFVGTGMSGLSNTVHSEQVFSGNNDDVGYRRDTGNEISRSLALYPGELVDNSPGRGRTGTISSTDLYDWFLFSVCQGQQIFITVAPPVGFDVNISLWTMNNVMVISSNTSGDAPEIVSFIATYSGYWYLQIAYVWGDGIGQYVIDIDLQGQNDAGSGADAPNTIEGALVITQGTFFGYLDMNDPYDWYTFYATKGEWIRLLLKIKNYYAYLTDFDLQLYNTNGSLVYEGNRYYDENISYPVDVTGLWSIRVDIYPGWVDCPHPANWSYYSYGSGAYNLTVAFETSGIAPPGPISPPDITPIAKTYKVVNDATSTKDDFAYLAAIPACNYVDGGQRYLAPIIYINDTTPTAYYDDETSFGVVDDTTQYLSDDWNTYLSLFGKTPDEYTLATDPIQAAADIASREWASSQTAVVAVDGSGFEDTMKTVLKRTALLRRQAKFQEFIGNFSKIKIIGDAYVYPLFLGPKWCALNVSLLGESSSTPSINAIFPLYMMMQQDWWPTPYDGSGSCIDTYYPVTRMGIWATGYDTITSKWTTRITQYAGDRYHFRITDTDSSIYAQLTTTKPSDLIVFLVDPQGYLRAPDVPNWNGPVNPIHVWNGLSNPSDNPWRTWHPAPHTEFSAEVLHPETGLWTAIVVPREANGSNVRYTLTVDVKTVNPNRADAVISAANAAVIASLHHYPLLYVNKDTVPDTTANAFSTLGVTKVIFVERGEIGMEVRSKLPFVEKDLTTMLAIIDEIKSHPSSENYVTVTSLKTQDGFFAPGAMLAAYHGSPVLRVEEASGDPARIADRIHTWRLWAGDYYHGGRDLGSLPVANAPIEITKLELFSQLVRFFLGKDSSLPTFGLDADRYWNEEMYQNMHGYIQSLGLDKEGAEGYCFVAPRNDIPVELSSTMMGNNSYAGDIPGLTPAYSSAVIVRDLLYPALIWANPDRNITTSQIMNYRDSGSFWWYPTGVPGYTSRTMKDILYSRLRTFEGHCLWDASLQRMNQGASVMVYCGHSTGGSGLAGQYVQTNYSNYPDQIWWDGWRGYMYDNWHTARDIGMVWYNPEPPNLHDFIHFKWVDQQLQNLRSNIIIYASIRTGDTDGPLVYLDHGAACWVGYLGTGYIDGIEEQSELLLMNTMIKGESLGPALARYIWVYSRDYTSGDSYNMYNWILSQYHYHPCIYGDPDFLIYSPEWTIPVPIDN
jgi:hypothetical protein